MLERSISPIMNSRLKPCWVSPQCARSWLQCSILTPFNNFISHKKFRNTIFFLRNSKQRSELLLLLLLVATTKNVFLSFSVTPDVVVAVVVDVSSRNARTSRVGESPAHKKSLHDSSGAWSREGEKRSNLPSISLHLSARGGLSRFKTIQVLSPWLPTSERARSCCVSARSGQAGRLRHEARAREWWAEVEVTRKVNWKCLGKRERMGKKENPPPPSLGKALGWKMEGKSWEPSSRKPSSSYPRCHFASFLVNTVTVSMLNNLLMISIWKDWRFGKALFNQLSYNDSKWNSGF